MATVFRSPITVLQFFGNNGLPLVGGTLLTTVGGVNTTTYQDAAGSIPLPNPIPLNSRGEVSNAAGQSCELWLLANTTYTFTLSDASGNQINQYPNIAGALDASSGVTLAGNNTFTGANTFSGNVQVIDANFAVVDNVDPTKKITFQAAGLPTATTAVLNVAAANIVEGVAGTAIASAATINLDTATGDYDSVTGTATTTAITLTSGRQRTVVAAAAWQITAGATLIMTGVVASGATYTCSAGDVLIFRGESASVRLVGFTPANPAAVSGAGGSSLVFLSALVASSSASIAFTGLPSTYDEFIVEINSAVPATDTASLILQFSIDNGATYIATSTYGWGITGRTFGVTTGPKAGGTATGASIAIGGIPGVNGLSNDTTYGGYSGTVTLKKFSSTTQKKKVYSNGIGTLSNTGADPCSMQGAGISTSATTQGSAVNGIRFQMDAGNTASGEFYLYAVKKS